MALASRTWKRCWRPALRHLVVVAIAIMFLAFAKDPLIDLAFESPPASIEPMLLKSWGPTALGYGAMGVGASLAALIVVAAPYWLMSRLPGLPVRGGR